VRRRGCVGTRAQLKRLADPDGARAQQLEYTLSIGMDLLGPRPVTKIDEATIDELVDALIDQRLAIEAARERGQPLMEDYVDARTGRTHRRRRRGLSNSTINLAIGAHQRVLRYAHRQGLIERLPDLSECRQRAQRPRRSYLQPTEIEIVLIAASQLEQENSGLDWAKVNYIRTSSASAVELGRELGVSDTLIRKVRRRELWDGSPERPNRNDVPRRAIIEALLLLGPRVAELCAWRGHDVDLAARRVRIRREVTKTDAGERVIPTLPAVHERLVEHRAQRPYAAVAPLFPTRNGRPNTPGNVLNTALAPVLVRANELLEAKQQPPIGHLTPHTLRRTFASMIAVCDVSPRRAMYLMGHTDPTLTLGVYQQVLDVSDHSLDLLEDLIGCSLDDAKTLFDGGARRSRRGLDPGTIPERGDSEHSPGRQQ
jgi:integrase